LNKRPVRFYFSSRQFDPVPLVLEEYSAWQAEIARRGGIIGPACWAVQTYLQLKKRGFSCELVQEIPGDGIAVAHYDDCPSDAKAAGDAYWICALADRPAIQPFAHMHVLQNSHQRTFGLQRSACIPLWPQSGLLPRSPHRADSFTNVGFYGELISLAADFQSESFQNWCTREGFKLHLVSRDQWHDYSNCDVVLAVRSVDGSCIHGKPPSKLLNAWRAGVPAILGLESGYRAIAKPGAEYLEARSVYEVQQCLVELRDRLELRKRLIETGWKRAGEFSDDTIAKKWISLLDTRVGPLAERWANSSLAKPIHRAASRVRQGLAWRYQLIGSTELGLPNK